MTPEIHDASVARAMPRLKEAAGSHPYPLVFATISGAHLYGFPSPDSDFDLRGVHVLPLDEVLGLWPKHETVEQERFEHGLELDLVTHDAAKFFRLLLKKNGYVLEQLLSPLVVHTTPGHEELQALAPGLITRHHAHHYLGFSRTQWGLFLKDRRIKPLLYTYRVLMTGIHLMRSGLVEANIVRLNDTWGLPHVADLVARKTGGSENDRLEGDDFAFHEREYQRLGAELEAAHVASTLPEEPAAGAALDDLLIRIRLGGRH